MARNYVGLACTGHDGALAVVDDAGRIVFAEATERALQNKRALDVSPDRLVATGRVLDRYCDPDAELVVARSWGEGAVETIGKERAAAIKTRRDVAEAPLYAQSKSTLQREITRYLHVLSLVSDNIERSGRQLDFDCDGRSVSHRAYEHHLTHAAAACFTSPFDNAVCAVIDGFGEGSASRFYAYEDGRLRELGGASAQVGGMGVSLGLFYSRLCRLCGFDPWLGEEWKVMGLAPYGQLDRTSYDLMRRSLRVQGLEFVMPPDALAAMVSLQARSRAPEAPILEAADLAFTGQHFYCETMRTLLSNLHALGLSDNLVLTGGCALNSSWNGRVLDETPFERLHVCSAPADDGNAIGAALLAYHEDNPDRRPDPGLQSPFLGSTADPEAIDQLRQFSGIPGLESFDGTVHVEAARLLAEGKIIGWMQGRAEFGPRALGNRSILADPRKAEMKDRLNARVKFREAFRPFAPSVLHEHGPKFFENYQESRYMERTLRFTEYGRQHVPAVVHVDGTGRLQTVKREWNPKYHALIEAFHQITGVGLVLNTSFNIMGKPIVHSVQDAVAAFFTTGLDALVIEDVLIQKP